MNRQPLNRSIVYLRRHRHSPVVQLRNSLSTTSTSTSTSPSKKKLNLQESLSSTKPPNSQPFVTHRLRPGQPNPATQIYKHRQIKSDPIHKPAWKHNTKANIISAEDFANRPRVSFEEQFDSLHDGMIVLSWLNEKQRQDIFNSYTSMMIETESKFGVTSHEYVMRVIGEKYNISSMRVGAIVQNCHDEEQMAKHDPEYVHDKVSEYVDAKIQEHITNCYNAYGEVNPNEYIEEPVESSDLKLNNSTGAFVSVEDLYDVDELTKAAILREKDDAQLEIDGHVYNEDVDDGDIESKVNKECMELIGLQNQAFKEMTDSWKRNEDGVENPMPHGGKIETEDEDGNIISKDVERRPRWKYVAQTINTREVKKLREKGSGGGGGRRGKKSKKEMKKNTLVEQDGLLRVATMKEVNEVAWKAVRDPTEFGFQGVKTAWLNRKNGEKGGWGRVPDDVKAAARAKLEEETKEANTEENEEQDGDDNNDDTDTDSNAEKDEK